MARLIEYLGDPKQVYTMVDSLFRILSRTSNYFYRRVCLMLDDEEADFMTKLSVPDFLADLELYEIFQLTKQCVAVLYGKQMGTISCTLSTSYLRLHELDYTQSFGFVR